MKRGTYVSRSVYQRLFEENKRLRSDIYSLVIKPGSNYDKEAREKWTKYFNRRRNINDMIIELIKLGHIQDEATHTLGSNS